MKISVELKFEQLLQFVRELSLEEKKQLLEVVHKEVVEEEEVNELQQLLLEGPTWSDEEYQDFLEARSAIDKIGTDVID